MHSHERCFLHAVLLAVICLFGGALASFSTEHDVTTTTTSTSTTALGNADTTTDGPMAIITTIKDDIDNNNPSLKSQRKEDASETKAEYPTKETDPKSSTELKKKSVVDLKPKVEQKYVKPFKNESSKTVDSSTETAATTIVTDTTTNTPINIAIPLLVRGEPIGDGITTINEQTSSTTIQPLLKKPTIDKVVDEKTNVSRSRALNVSAPELINSLHANITDLSDVSMDENDKEVEGGEYVVPHNETGFPMNVNINSTMQALVPAMTTAPTFTCVVNNRTYATGEKVIRDCEEECFCGLNGQLVNCRQLCVPPYQRAGRNHDPLCHERIVPEEQCCVVLICSSVEDTDTISDIEDSAPEPEETCLLANGTIVQRGQRIEDGCSKICICETGGKLKCQPRCPPNETSQHDRCVILTDPRDQCCKITLCDVTLGDLGHDIKTETSGTDFVIDPTDVKVLNSTAIKLKLSTKKSQDLTIEISDDNIVWMRRKPDKDGIISNLQPARNYYVRVTDAGRIGPSLRIVLPAEVTKTNVSEKIAEKNTCVHRGKTYKIGAEWYDECISFCVCTETGKTECVTIECPTDFGLDVLDPKCLEWETVPPNFVPKAPKCCPQEVRCKNNGSCNYEGKTYVNWSELPSNVTGCEKKCYCEMGKVSCQAVCAPVPALPPRNLPCPPYQASLTHLPDDDCCLHWTCSGSPINPIPGANVTPAFPGPLAIDTSNRQSINDKKITNNGMEIIKPVQTPGRGTPLIQDDTRHNHAQTGDSDGDQKNIDKHTLMDVHPHYPMDPGRPVVVYKGPYNPDYASSHVNVEDVFHIAPPTPQIPAKEKSKSKFPGDSKKNTELSKQHKEPISYFPGPLSADKLPTLKPNSENQHTFGLNNGQVPKKTIPNVVPNPGQRFLPNSHRDSSVVNVIPLIPGIHNDPYVNSQDQGSPDQYRDFVYDSSDGHRENTGTPESVYTNGNPGSAVSNIIVPNNVNPQLKQTDYVKQGQRDPNRDIVQGQINLQHPSFVHSNVGGQIVQKDYDGYVPTKQRPIEELLAHLSHHDPNPGPYQSYPPLQPGANHDTPITGHIVPLRTDVHAPLYSQHPPYLEHLTHSHHNPIAAQTIRLNQSGIEHNLPPGFPLSGGIPGFPLPISSDEITVQILEALDENTVRLVFTVPQVLVGLHGRVELRYTSDETNLDPSTWKFQIFAPPDDLIATPQLEFELGKLKPSTVYKVKITVKLKDLNNSPESKIYTVRTADSLADLTTLPPQIPVDAELKITKMNSSWIEVSWKRFTEYELQFIDGVQLKYRERDGKVFSTTPLIHRAVRNYLIENLKPSTTYEIGIYLVPFAGQSTELISKKTIQIATSTEPDPYFFEVKVEIKTVKSTEVEISWSGVPYPEDKYVNIYRAIYQSDSGKEDTSMFKIAKRDSPAKTMITDLKPGTRYRLWIEVYLTNGRIKKSNVQDFVTKPGVPLPNSAVLQEAGKFASIPLHDGDYYGPLVIVAIVASLAILSTLILLMILMKRRASNKADISPRKATSAYDNPSYKTCEDAVTASNGRSKATEHEMTTINTNAKETA